MGKKSYISFLLRNDFEADVTGFACHLQLAQKNINWLNAN